MSIIRPDRHHPHAGGRRRQHQRGFTLIEMLIAITIGLGILAGLVGVLASNAGNARSNDRTSELMTNGRYALNAIKQELREAGFRGYTWAEPLAPAALGGITNECLEAGAVAGQFISNIRQGVWGSNNANPYAGSCVPAANYVANTDVLVVRRLNPTPTPTASLVANSIYFHTTYDRGQMFRGVTPPKSNTTVASAAGRRVHGADVMKPGTPGFHGNQARRAINRCASCHDQGAQSNCVRCHKVGELGGNPHPTGFSWRGQSTACRENVMCGACHIAGAGCK